MTIPMILKKKEKQYILEKIYKTYALYSNLDNGVKECFSLHELGMIEQRKETRKASRGGAIKI